MSDRHQIGGGIYQTGAPLTRQELAELEELDARLDDCRGGFLINWRRRRRVRQELADFLHEAAERRRANPAD